MTNYKHRISNKLHGVGLSLIASAIPITFPMSIRADNTFNNEVAQVTSVSQLSDVQPTDWAFTALQSLVERYGCIAGYPNGTFRGNRATSRYEFAAGLNACLDKINELISTGLADKVGKEDLATLQKLQTEFAAELTALKGRVDSLEAKVSTLEEQQFSTTTKLTGEVIFSAVGATGSNVGFNTPNVTFGNRVRLNFTTAFPNGGTLITGLQATNLGAANSIQSVLGYNDIAGLNSSTVRTGTEVQFPVSPNNTGVQTANNGISLYKLLYIQPVNKNFIAFAGTNAEVTDAFPQISPLFDASQGSISRFGTAAASTRLSGGTSGFGLASAVGFIWLPSEQIDIRALYGNINAALPGNVGTSPVGSGAFGGSYIFSTQLTYTPVKSLALALNYAYSSHDINILGTGLTSQDINAIPTKNAGTSLGNRVNLNTIGLTMNWGFVPKVDLTATGSLIFANLNSVDANATFTSWMVGLNFKDLLAEGNRLGLLFGQPLNRSSLGGSQAGAGNNTTTPYQLETFFNFRLSKNISVTPGVFFVFNPEGLGGRPTTTVGVIRTTFTF